MPDSHGTGIVPIFQTGLFLLIEYAMERVMCIIILFLILIVAVITDLLFDKIYNEWILLAMAAGLSHAVWKGGSDGLVCALLSMAVPILLLYPLFMIGGLGAGDIKLLAAAGCFLTIKETFLCLGMSFFLGAILSLLKMAAEKNFLQRMKYLLSYICDVFKSGEWKFYEEDFREKKQKEGKIHFSLPVLLAMVIYKGGIHW